MPSIRYYSNCSFIQEANFNTVGNEGKEIKQTLWLFCISLHLFIDLIKKMGKHYKDTIKDFKKRISHLFWKLKRVKLSGIKEPWQGWSLHFQTWQQLP